MALYKFISKTNKEYVYNFQSGELVRFKNILAELVGLADNISFRGDDFSPINIYNGLTKITKRSEGMLDGYDVVHLIVLNYDTSNKGFKEFVNALPKWASATGVEIDMSNFNIFKGKMKVTSPNTKLVLNIEFESERRRDSGKLFVNGKRIYGSSYYELEPIFKEYMVFSKMKYYEYVHPFNIKEYFHSKMNECTVSNDSLEVIDYFRDTAKEYLKECEKSNYDKTLVDELLSALNEKYEFIENELKRIREENHSGFVSTVSKIEHFLQDNGFTLEQIRLLNMWSEMMERYYRAQRRIKNEKKEGQ